MMVVHSAILALIAYLIMVFVFRQNTKVAEDRSVLIGAFILGYMVLFGHSLPTKINKRLF